MNLFKSLKLQFSPPKLNDPDFGQLKFMFISNHPERSYWEAEWIFPPTGNAVSIALDGDQAGPRPETRLWHLSLPGRYERILALVRPELERVFNEWLKQDLPHEILSVVKVSGFGVKDPCAIPIEWDISFETTGEEWLGITIPFRGDEPQEAVVDT